MWVAILSKNHRSWEMTSAEPGRQQYLLQCPQCLHIQVVGRLIQQQYVGTLFQKLGEVQAVALSAREILHKFLLV